MRRNISQQQEVSGLIDCFGWFTLNWHEHLRHRELSMQAALGLWAQRGGYSIVETGCQRVQYDPGAGMSTTMLCNVLRRCGGYLWSVDITPEFVEACRAWTEDTADCRQIDLGDSVEYLYKLLPEMPYYQEGGLIDLLYLDSYDYPYGELLNLYGGETDIHKATDDLFRLDEAEILRRHGEIVAPSQEHCLREIQAAWPLLGPNSVVLIDDNRLPGGGKPRTAKIFLRAHGWHCVMDCYQTLWIPGPLATFPGVKYELEFPDQRVDPPSPEEAPPPAGD